MRTTVFGFSLSLLLVGVAPAQDSLNCREVGYYDTPGWAFGVAVAGNYAFVADEGSGLRVISVADPAHPSEAGYCATPGRALGVAVAGDYAYVADYNAGYRVISVADPVNPTEAGYYDTPGMAYGVAVTGNYAYVADGNAGLRVIEFYGAGVQETTNDRRAPMNVRPTVVRSLPQGAVAFDAMGRRATSARPGIYFVREAQAQAQAQAVRKVIITR